MPISVFTLAALLIALHVGRYVVMAGGAYLVFWKWKSNPVTKTRRLQHAAFTSEDLRREVLLSLLTAVLFGSFFAVVYGGQTPRPLVYSGLWGALEFCAWLLLVLVVHDTFFYWSHRLSHHRALFRHAHRVHHLSRNPSPFAALAFHPLDAFVQIIWAVPLGMLLPIPSSVWLAFAFVAMFINVLGHCGVELYPRSWATHPVLGWLNSASAHDQHHLKLERNFGLYFTFWDRVCGTAERVASVALEGATASGVVELLHRPEERAENAADDLDQHQRRDDHRHRDGEEAHRAQ
ncbi:MAG: sterol desaturase family protein [Archangium sp.]|nr:sterol desaturase family protein [Archangium sp.]